MQSIWVSGSVGHTKSTGDERFWHACSVKSLLILEHFLSVNFQPQLNTHTQTHTPTHTHTDKQYQYDTASHYYVLYVDAAYCYRQSSVVCRSVAGLQT